MFREGSQITATAPTTGLVGIEFDYWTATGTTLADPSLNPLQFIMPAGNVTLTAVYKLKKLHVDVSIHPDSKVAVEGNALPTITRTDGKDFDEFFYGDEIKITAPYFKANYRFWNWRDAAGNQVSSDYPDYTVTLRDNLELVAWYGTYVTFLKEEEYNSSGYVKLGGERQDDLPVVMQLPLGEAFEVEAVAELGRFGGWYLDGTLQALAKKDQIKVMGPAKYKARFVSAVQFAIVTCLSEKNDGSINGIVGTLTLTGEDVRDQGNGSYKVPQYSSIRLVATPASGDNALPLFRVVEVMTSTEEVLVAIDTPIAITNTDRTFKARWGVKATFTIGIFADGAKGKCSFDGNSTNVSSITCEQDSQVTVVALALSGFKFEGWYSDGAKVSAVAKYTFTVSGNETLEARFEEDTAIICAWEGSANNKRLSWASKVYVLPKPFDPVAARVDGTGYPVKLSVGTYSSPDATPTRDHSISVADQRGRRLPRMRAERFMRIAVESVAEVDAVVVATNLLEVN